MQCTVNQVLLKYVKWVVDISLAVLLSRLTHPVSMHTDTQTAQKLLSGLYQGWTYSCFVKYHYFGAWHLEYEFNLFQSF